MAGTSRLVTESFLQLNFIPNGEFIDSADDVMCMSCDQINERYTITISGITSIGARLPGQNQLGALPGVATVRVYDIGQTIASVESQVLTSSGSNITEKGVCWGTSPNPMTSGNKVIYTGSVAYYDTILTGLVVNTTYYVRAYAINASGTGYGHSIKFTTSFTQTMVPWIKDPYNKVGYISCPIAGIITTNSCGLYSGVNSTGEQPTRSGIIWAIGSTPSFENNDSYLTDEIAGDHANCFNITGLAEFTTYSVRAWSQNSLGYAYSDEVFFTTLSTAPYYPNVGEDLDGGIIVERIEEADYYTYLVVSDALNNNVWLDWWDSRNLAESLPRGLYGKWRLPSRDEAGKVRNYQQSFTIPLISPLNVNTSSSYWTSERSDILFVYQAKTLDFWDQSAGVLRNANHANAGVFAVRIIRIYKT